MRHCLELADRAAELLARARVLRRVLDQPGSGSGEIRGERDVVERERAAGVATSSSTSPS